MYSIYIIKATRKPVYVGNRDHFDDAHYMAEYTYNTWKLLNNNDMASTGVSVQVVDSTFDSEISEIEIGGLPKKSIIFQFGGW